jgi:hypothetical protein
MNKVVRRMFAELVDAGGDPSDEGAVERLIRLVEARLFVSPPKVRRAVERFWRGNDEVMYSEVAAEMGISTEAAYQLVARFMRAVTAEIRRQSWQATPQRGPSARMPSRRAG